MHHRPSQEHTTLLLSAYAKLKDAGKVSAFVDGEHKAVYASPGGPYPAASPRSPLPSSFSTSSSSPAAADAEGVFDVEAAVAILAGDFPDHAFRLALRHRRYLLCADIQVQS